MNSPASVPPPLPTAPTSTVDEITYRIEPADMKAFQRHYRRISPAIGRLRIFSILLLLGLSLHSALDREGPLLHRSIQFLVTLAIISIVYLGVGAIANWLINWRSFRDGERHGVLGEHTITLPPETLQERTAVNDSKTVWRSLYRIDSTADHLFIFTQPNTAHVIPRRAFPTPASAEAFLATAQRYFEAARAQA